MAKSVFLSVSLVEESYSKNDILEYLKNYVLDQVFDKLTVIVSRKTRKILADFFDFLNENEIYFSVWQGEDNETIEYIKNISDSILSVIGSTDSISLEGFYLGGFLITIWVTTSSKESEQANSLFERGKFNLKCGKYKEALELFDKALALELDNEELMIFKGVALFKLEMYKDTIIYCDRALKKFPESKFMLFLKGMSLEKAGSTEEALFAFDKVIEKYPEYAYAWFVKGVFLHNIKQNSESLECFNKAVELKSDDFIAWYQRGIVLSESDRFEEAVESFDKALELVSLTSDKKHRMRSVLVDFISGLKEVEFLDSIGYAKANVEQIYLEKAFALAQLDRHKEAISSYNKAIRINPKNLQSWLGKGAELQILERYRDSLKCFEKVLKQDPQNVMALRLKAISEVKINWYLTAKETFWKLVEINPNDADSLGKLISILVMAYDPLSTRVTLEEIRKAIEMCDGILQNDPENIRMLLWKARALEKVFFYDAIKVYKKVLEIDPFERHALRNLGLILANSGGVAESIELFDRLLKQDPNNVTALTYKGYSLLQLERFAEAKEALEKAVEIEPTKLRALEFLAQLLEDTKNYDEALKVYKRIQDLYPEKFYINYRTERLVDKMKEEGNNGK